MSEGLFWSGCVGVLGGTVAVGIGGYQWCWCESWQCVVVDVGAGVGKEVGVGVGVDVVFEKDLVLELECMVMRWCRRMC